MTPVVHRSAAAQVADQLVTAVREQRLEPGARLPSERELAERFGVSRPTIREALAALELAGIVASHQGRGTSVTGTSAQVAMWGVEILPPQIFEARLAIEPELARLAAEKRYPEDVAQIRATFEALDARFAADGNYADDFPMHRAVARAARNPILERALEDALIHTQGPRWQDLTDRVFVTPEARAGHHEEARRVLQFIERGKPAEAADVWRQHLVYFRDEMLGRLRATA